MIEIRCETCNAITLIDSNERERIREELSRLGPAARRIWECPRCHQFQIVFALREKTERMAA